MSDDDRVYFPTPELAAAAAAREIASRVIPAPGAVLASLVYATELGYYATPSELAGASVSSDGAWTIYITGPEPGSLQRKWERFRNAGVLLGTVYGDNGSPVTFGGGGKQFVFTVGGDAGVTFTPNPLGQPVLVDLGSRPIAEPWARWGTRIDQNADRNPSRGPAIPPSRGGPPKPKGGGKGPPKGPGGGDRGGGKGKGPSETSPTNPPEKGTTGSSRGSDYRETGGPSPSKGKTVDEKPKGGAGRGGGDTGGGFVPGERKVESTTRDPYTGAIVQVFTITTATGAVTTGVATTKDGITTVSNQQEDIDRARARAKQAEEDRAEQGKKDEKKDEKKEENKEEKPPETKKKTEDDENAQQNTTRGNPLDDDGGDDHESRRFTHRYMPPETRALFAFTELGRALAPKGPPLPGSGGPTDRGWTPFRARTAAAGPPESAAYGREALKNAFAEGAIGGALAGRPYHGRPTDDGGQVPVAADARTSGDESDADAKASRDAVSQMYWNKHVAPRIRYARRIR